MNADQLLKGRSKKREALEDIVSVLVSHWGFDAVAACLAHLATDSSDSPSKPGRHVSGSKPRPSEIVGRLKESESRRELLGRLALAFEDKAFLPSIGHIREFIAMHGQEVALPRNRNEAFRTVLKQLLELSDDELLRISTSDIYAGPSQLAPLSDAIGTVGRGIRGIDKAPPE